MRLSFASVLAVSIFALPISQFRASFCGGELAEQNCETFNVLENRVVSRASPWPKPHARFDAFLSDVIVEVLKVEWRNTRRDP